MASQTTSHILPRPVSAGTGPRARGTDAIVGDSVAIDRVRRWITRVAATHVPVLITGETGTGKELVASAIHAGSARASRRLLSLNCAALPDTLVESELFGHDRGAFTGAHEARIGLLRSCDGGTLFLDEVGDLSLAAQAKLLRVVEAKQVSRLGDGRTWPVDFRLVAATNRDLETMVQQGHFRKDLFYRLSVACLHVPPLRDRLDDLPQLVTHCLTQFNRAFDVAIQGVSLEAMDCLQAHTWPGNVRELRNVLESAYLTCTGPLIDVVDLPSRLHPDVRHGPRDAHADSRSQHEPLARAAARRSDDTRHSPAADDPTATSQRTGEAGERERLLSTLAAVQWNKSRAASLLHWSRMTLYRKLAKYGLGTAGAHADARDDERDDSDDGESPL